ncbi:uncharacterized protein K452DRAFT_324751 [Aplosporella prunicola CBS 121167]|uniref:VPS9 domain-containing protein n=1 Tax=Aplosporella prunicola CBS 121167 TaxID=1176127 RepID=A0A6A6BNU5_9PEZI|nr:uncharacterized protein K452DRAFT_324751 [Aplosporella prunicola CBS 121167]KAF2144935.1 hypothetical protein K452DRAFT_324751 [Aplosporella prunicola CBS 121167]
MQDSSEDRPKQQSASPAPFSRFDRPRHRSRASTVGATIPEILYPNALNASPESNASGEKKDIFAAKRDGADDDEEADPSVRLPHTFEDLPIEIRSLAERFLDSLSARVHPTPLSIEQLSEMFQDFYVRASAQIDTHIAALSTRLSRQQSSTSMSTRSSRSSLRKASDPGRSDQQMLTASEISDRKKARRLLEHKRVALEETVERSVCEKVYEKIWRHRSTDDGERDEKLRSRTAALSVVGIGLKELLGHGEEITPAMRESMTEKEAKIPELLSGARESIQKMNEEKYPLGKLQHLTAAHKSIVETLSQIFPSSSSADEILPTLIYTLITSPPENICAISNLYFIQRFRTTSKIDGETAYCLVNLEASIAFLENVDLSTLREGEVPEGPAKSTSRPSTPRPESQSAPPMDLGISYPPGHGKANLEPIAPAAANRPAPQPLPSPLNASQRRLSNLIQAQTTRIEAASESARQAVLDGADVALDSFNNTLDNSLKFLFGRLKEQQVSDSADGTGRPKTLEDVRKLVSTPPLNEDDNASGASSLLEKDSDEPPNAAAGRSRSDSRITDLFGGRRAHRDNSVDSAKSGNSGSMSRRPTFTPTSDPLSSPTLNTTEAPPKSPAPPQPPSTPGNVAVESMRNLGNTLNPLRGFGGMAMLPRFGRSNTTPAPAAAASPEKPRQASQGEAPKSPAVPPATPVMGTETSSAAAGQADAKAQRAQERLDELARAQPPAKKFVEVKEAVELRLGEVEELLREYQRLAGVVNDALRP